jgi:hypothetical protein
MQKPRFAPSVIVQQCTTCRTIWYLQIPLVIYTFIFYTGKLQETMDQIL